MIRNPYKRPRQSSPTSSKVSKTSKESHLEQENTENAAKQAYKPTSQFKSAVSNASALVIAAADKAGMKGIDRERINAIILRESGNSLYMQQQRRRDAKVDERVAVLKQRMAAHEKEHPSFQQELQPSIDQYLEQLIAVRPNRSVCVVVDMDMFFMACEMLSRPELRDKPACVGGNMISTSNYRARQYGVRSAMAGYIGDALVKELSGGKEELIHVKAHYELYKDKSVIMKQTLAEYDPHVRVYSLDEALVQLGPYIAHKLRHPEWTHEMIREALRSNIVPSGDDEAKFDGVDEKKDDEQRDTDGTDDQPPESNDSFYRYTESSSDDHNEEWSLDILQDYTSRECLQVAADVMNTMRDHVRQATGGLTCSSGLGPNFMLAKIASDFNKPAGQYLVPPHHTSVISFLHPLPLRKVCGVGRVMDKMCKEAFGIETVQHLYEKRALIQQFMTPSSSKFLLRASVGCSSGFFSSDQDDSKKERAASQKGASRERTFSPTHNWGHLMERLEKVGKQLAQDMERKQFWAKTVTLKVKLKSYDVLSRARSLHDSKYAHTEKDILDIAQSLLVELRDEYLQSQERGTAKPVFSLRLLGIRCSNFRSTEEDQQQQQKQKRLDDIFAASAAVSKTDAADTKVVATSVCINAPPPPITKKGPVSSTITAATTISSPPRPPKVEDEELTVFECPICGQRLAHVKSNDQINQHIDSCLNSDTVRRAAREETLQKKQGTKKKRISDFFS